MADTAALIGRGVVMVVSTARSAPRAVRSCTTAARTKRTGRSVTLQAPGGQLHVEWRDDDHVILTGAAEWEFSGSFDPATGIWTRDTESAA